MIRIFSPDSPYKKQARFMAVLWTSLIFIGCLTPGQEIPHVAIPLIDKWVHLVMFGVFTFLWLCGKPTITARWLGMLAFYTVCLGSLIEGLQGVLSFLGRSMEFLDVVADTLGGLLGIGLFVLFAGIAGRRK